MYFKRNEPFRYTFGTPVMGQVKNPEAENKVDMKIWDISQHGMRIELLQSFQTKENDTVHVFFTLLDQEFSAVGTVKWVKSIAGVPQVGIDLDTDSTWRQTLVQTLKQYAKNHI
ncbi:MULTISPECIES: PilZ domain-containing protein [Pontibacillus]|uniref:PilZ domain-containing protein n=1 Tax=Pontibacillus chungwhensis TaxID=265426 RepID=A0ABY8V426_9BACI|nr:MULTISPECIES: PilZ domain-containing protein [Pontibacillus]MCD5322481.1 PilZ domain-containing protein [Pontibacillus sp. HN14]WIF99766.1 PilZ domain-containing protein [Pontibacillus chungwhensis]